MNARSILVQSAPVAVIFLTCASASAAPRVVDLDGLRSRRVDIAAGVRLADAGAVIAATIERRGALRAAVVRLRHDGSVVEGFGRGGVTLAGPRGATALAVTSDARGRRIVVAVRGPHGRLRLIGVDAHGRRRSGFGRHGARVLGPAEPTALAARGARVAVAHGSSLALLDARSGKTLAAATAQGCLTPRTAQLAGDRLIVAGDAASCRPAIDLYAAATLAPAGAAPVDGARALALELPGERTLCVAEQDGSQVRARRADPARLLDGDPFAGAPALGATDRLTALAPDPRGGCNLLLARPASGGRVVQTERGGGVAMVTTLPQRFRPRVVFVCRRHVLAAGVRRSGGRLVGALAVVERHGHG